MSLRKSTIFFPDYLLCRYLLADMSATQMAQSLATHVIRIVQLLYRNALLVIELM